MISFFRYATAQDRRAELPFVFMDESGKKESDRFFVCGFLQIADNIQFARSLQRVVDQVKNLSIRNRQNRVDHLLEENNLNELHSLARSFNEFELKHYCITNENQRLYSDLLKVLWSKTSFRFTGIAFDRKDPNYVHAPDDHHALYLKALKLFMKSCISDIQYIYVPDNFDIHFDWNVSTGHLPVAILPLESNAALQLQVADILTGLIAQALRRANSETTTRKDEVRQPVLNTLENLLGKQIKGNVTVNKPNYFSVWLVKLKRSGHGQETQPQPSASTL